MHNVRFSMTLTCVDLHRFKFYNYQAFHADGMQFDIGQHVFPRFN